MNDQNMTTASLLSELAALQQRVAELEAAEERHKQIEERLRASEEEKTLVINSISESVLFHDRELRVRWANRAAAESVGSSLDSLVGRNCYQTWNERNSPCENCPVVKAMETGEVQQGEIMTPDQRVWLVTGTPVKGDTGKLLGSVERVMEITERKRAEEDRWQREEQFRAFVETTDEWIWAIDLEGNHTFCNPAVETILGYSPQNFVGKDSLRHLHEEDRPRFEEMLKEKIAKKGGWSGYVFRWRHKNGSYRYLESTAVPILDQQGRLLGFRGADRNISERKHAEEALRENEARFRSLVETTSDWIWEVDAQVAYTYASPKVMDLLGYEPHEVIGKKPFDFMPSEEARRVASLVAPILAAARPFVGIENINLHKDGRLVYLETSGVPILDAEGRLQGYRGIDRDITERKRADERLRYLSAHDVLTGIFNRLFFEEEMSRLDHSRQFPISIIIADVDGLKAINDRLGHPVGDELLRRTALVLKETFRAEEIVARVGGDEFAVLLPHIDGTAAEVSLHRIRNKLLAHNAAHAGPSLGISLGAATAETPGLLAEALKRADERMYREKMAHKGHSGLP